MTATRVENFTQRTGRRVAIHKVVGVGQAMNLLKVFGRVVNGGHRIAVRNNVEGVLVQILHRHGWVQGFAGNDRVGTGKTNAEGFEKVV